MNDANGVVVVRDFFVRGAAALVAGGIHAAVGAAGTRLRVHRARRRTQRQRTNAMNCAHEVLLRALVTATPAAAGAAPWRYPAAPAGRCREFVDPASQ
jgi:hypothetical protein